MFKYLCFGWGCFAVTVGTYRLLSNPDPLDLQGNKPFLFFGVVVLLISGTFIVLRILDSGLSRKTFQSRKSQILIRDMEYDLNNEYEVKSNDERSLSRNAPFSVNAVLAVEEQFPFEALLRRQPIPGSSPNSPSFMDNVYRVTPYAALTKAIYYYSAGFYSASQDLLTTLQNFDYNNLELQSAVTSLWIKTESRSDRPGSSQLDALKAGQRSQMPYSAVLWALENGHTDEEVITALIELLALQDDQSAVEPNDLKEGTPNTMPEKDIYDEGLNQVLGSMLNPATSQGRDFWSTPQFFDLWDNFDAKTYAFFLSIETMHPTLNYRDLISASLWRRVNGDEDSFNLSAEEIREALLSVSADLKKATAMGGGAQAHMHNFGTPSSQWRWVPTGYDPETDTHWVY